MQKIKIKSYLRHLKVITVALCISFNAQPLAFADTLFATEENEGVNINHWEVDPFEGLDLTAGVKNEGDTRVDIDGRYIRVADGMVERVENELFLNTHIEEKMVLACRDKLPSPLIEVSVTDNDYVLYKYKDFISLNAEVSQQTLGPRDDVFVFGTTHVSYQYHYDVTAKYIQKGRTVCLSPQVRVNIEQSEQTVNIARELPNQSCLEREVILHELKHVQINKDNAQRMANEIKRTIEKTLEDNQIVFGSVAQTERWLENLSKTKLSDFISEMQIKFNRYHEQLDSIEESERLLTVCGGEGFELVRQISTFSR